MSNVTKTTKKPALKKGVSFRFRPEILKKLKAASAKSGLTMTKIIERLLERA